VLANGENRLRVVAAGFADTLELQRSGPYWVGAGNQPVELDFIMSGSYHTQGVRAMASAGAN
jgi:hypothetical protein